jgi:hypothetical protein
MLDAWAVMRRTGALWRLALISSAQVVLYTFIIGGLIAPMSVLTQLIVQTQQYDATNLNVPETAAVTASRAQIAQVVLWLNGHWVPLGVFVFIITAIWAVFGVYDVAATAGMISQAEAATLRRRASASAGLRGGFRIWWRTVGLLAIAAMPSLIYMLVIALISFFTVSLPIYRGTLPNTAAMSASNAITVPLSSIVSIASIPLGILVALGLRYAVLEDCEWRDAFRRAWRLAKSKLAEVAIMYFVVLVVLTMLSFVMIVAIAVVVAAAAVLVALFMGGSAGVLTGGSVFVIAISALLVTAVCIGTMALMLLWQSVAWTLFWRRLTGREPPTLTATTPAPVVPPARSQGVAQ